MNENQKIDTNQSGQERSSVNKSVDEDSPATTEVDNEYSDKSRDEIEKQFDDKDERND